MGKVCVTDSAEAPFSKVAYVEISDVRQVYAQGKIALKNGTGWGRDQIPANHAFGCLSAYGLYPLYEKSVGGSLPEEIYCCSERQSVHGRR